MKSESRDADTAVGGGAGRADRFRMRDDYVTAAA
jgi:hypothetical protein